MSEVSIIVPVYKVEPYLRQCVDSVLAQTFTDFELIIVDDGSPDSCGAICDEYAAQDNRVRVIHQENAGQGKSRNVGMDQAAGKYIIFLDGDDYWLPMTLDTLYTEAERNQTQVLLFGGEEFYDGIEVPKHVNPNWLSLNAQNGVVKAGPESLKISMDNHEYYSVAWHRFYLLSFLRSNGFRFDEGIIHEDVVFCFLPYLVAQRVECIGERLYRRRIRPGSTMNSSSIQSSAHGYRVVLDELLEFWLTHSLSEQQKHLLERYFAIRIDMVTKLYARAQDRNDRKAATFVQKELGPSLKRARALPGLPCSCRLATYSLFLIWFAHKAAATWLPRMIRERAKRERISPPPKKA